MRGSWPRPGENAHRTQHTAVRRVHPLLSRIPRRGAREAHSGIRKVRSQCARIEPDVECIGCYRRGSAKPSRGAIVLECPVLPQLNEFLELFDYNAWAN